jgi:DNA-binding response OmpR family regulator
VLAGGWAIVTDLKGLRVLVVEDEPLIAELVNEMLIDLGCVPVGPAATLDNAQALAATENLDAALLDVRLKGQDVFPLAQALLDRKIHIVFMSGLAGHSLPPQWQHCRSIGKPFSREEVAAALQP